ncbi:hypothetical protein [Planomicrobium okeanokoites]|uniref:YneQ n=1 Tax=Planomicrobium okeanokoites TaxID=244 RepID=A0ABV7KQ88_PLAOK|nr:hypothetical protein [Planomicrobium okeanokoites]TAA71072.1 hypothetical protein D2910_02025 [Planomicrobium okeanokoites]
MAFGIKRAELNLWKQEVDAGNIAFLTHYWVDDRFPGCSTVTKVGCSDLEKLKLWGRRYGLQPEWLDLRGNYPHFDLFGDLQKSILKAENLLEQLERLEKK